MPKSQQAALHRVGQEVAHEAYRDTEWLANAFVGALLMPARGLEILEHEHCELSPRPLSPSTFTSVTKLRATGSN